MDVIADAIVSLPQQHLAARAAHARYPPARERLPRAMFAAVRPILLAPVNEIGALPAVHRLGRALRPFMLPIVPTVSLRPQALQGRRAEQGGPHEATPGVHPEAPDRALPADAAVVAAAFN